MIGPDGPGQAQSLKERGQGRPMCVVSKNQENKDNFDGIKIEQPKVGPQGERHGCLKSYGPESAKLGHCCPTISDYPSKA